MLSISWVLSCPRDCVAFTARITCTLSLIAVTGVFRVGYVPMPEQWRWSSHRHYFLGEAGSVPVNVGWPEISLRDRAA
ncbi:MAG TPA: hypothetical protein VF753_14845 [Terriglobales bacterium]